jgi:ATP-dependent RNA helicase DOB1
MCSKKTDIYEGSLIRAFRLLVEVLRQMVQASKAIGNTELENKFASAITAIKRDIVFAPSLVRISFARLMYSIYDPILPIV